MAEAQLHHPTVGGKSLDNLPTNPYPQSSQTEQEQQQQQQQQQQQAPQEQERVPYKSWRKKYRKLRGTFDASSDENKRLFKEERKLQSIAKRLREELDGLLDLLTDLNASPSLPSHLRYNVALPPSLRQPAPIEVSPTITPEQANAMVLEYKLAVQRGDLPPLDLHVVRGVVEQRLAAQGVEGLEEVVERVVPRPVGRLPVGGEGGDGVGVEKGEAAVDEEELEQAGYLTTEQEMDYLARLDAKEEGLSMTTTNNVKSATTAPSSSSGAAGVSVSLGEPHTIIVGEEKHMASMTPRELERHLELLNPSSQHNWLRAHSRQGPVGVVTVGDTGDDGESLAGSEQQASGSGAASKRRRTGGGGSGGGGGGGGSKTLAKQVAERAVAAKDRDWSPGAASMRGEGDYEEDGASVGVEDGGVRRKGSMRDGDGAYRPKGGKSGAGASGGKGKRKRSSEAVTTGREGTPGAKKARLEGGAGER
ncbi:hypothetical protein BAUCODRAFT_126416 [Baudoinia panamericana UAMH 10762]|uniref:IEC3 subunit of the Ino80 complex, chromatin re-modelling-domain-containing protein n=1 Tax=Baudoinia panamericana (strain UAMH 10762) TaxID=717646 RepID=M2N0H0_BAUPA|nr:uncharacterized protein BAUCODRAFT_126416 [Baudoinia panamericana UAMH 10762]EMC92434.1 hypothetical protein BAUCODRAFT_126416 [Baudoinia panamericana UAMH 10762]